MNTITKTLQISKKAFKFCNWLFKGPESVGLPFLLLLYLTLTPLCFSTLFYAKVAF